MTDVYVGSEGPAPSDGELILEVRGGSLEAYGALYERHSGAARVLARQYVRCDGDADDVVADAFQRVLGVLQTGSGPDTHFRAYLFTVVRRLAADLAHGARRTRPTADDGTFEQALGPSASPEDPALAGFESSVVARAYGGLPERWQAVLWYTEVEELSPAQVAPILGLTPNGVSALAYRAREGLRVGYLQQHLTTDPSESCRAVNPLLGGYVRGGLALREVTKVERHLEVCEDCRTLVLELGDVAHGMRSVVAPLVLGLAGTALLGALPLGAATFGAGAAAGAGAGVAGSGATAATTAAGASTAAAGAGSSTAAAGAGAATAGTAATTGTAVGTTATAVGATATTATGAAAATAATGAAGVSGAAVVASTGAVAAATFGVVSVIGAIGDADAAQEVPDGPPVAVEASPWPTDGAEQAAPPASPDPSDDPTDPANVPWLEDPGDGVPEPAAVSVSVPDAGEELQPRATDYLTVQVSNPGGLPAVDAHVRFTLPAGMQYARSSAVQGAGPVPRPLTVETLPCTATAQPQEVLCRLGTIDAEGLATVQVPVVVRDGGTYDVVAEVWAEGVEARRLALPPTRVGAFGPELTTRAADVELAENPGLATIPFSVRNTGDLPTSDTWTVQVRVPAGLVPHTVTGGLSCEAPPGTADVWLCTGPALEPGDAVDAAVGVVADGTTVAGSHTVEVEPVSAVDGPTIGAASSVRVPTGWAGVIAGVGGVQASCRATGGVGEADAVVTGTYTNTTGRTVAVALSAAGSTATERPVLAPGAQATLVVPDGLRVPAGMATWTVSTTVAGSTYSRHVTSGSHGAAECYDPRWDVETTAQVVNDGGRVAVEGTIVNRGTEPMQAGMSVPGGESDRVRLGVGERSTFVVRTGSTSTEAGSATFDLYRWVLDVDGDQPAAGVVPATPPTAAYPAASIAPEVGTVHPAGSCRYDPDAEVSVRTFTVPLDNTGSTLPVAFRVEVGDHVEELRLAGGESARLDVDVPWGTGEAEVVADGHRLVTVDVDFPGCATTPSWPDVEVTAAAQCVEGDARVVVDVVDREGHDWRVKLLRGGATAGTRELPADGSVRLVVGSGGTRLPAGEVTVRLSRTVEGSPYTARRTVEHEGTRCVVIAPSASLDEGSARSETRRDGITSWREVGVVLDNAGSTVDVDFRVVGPGGQDTVVTVPAGATRTTEVRRVDGRDGGRWTVSTATWSTTLDVPRFTVAAAGWCAESIGWGRRYEVGEVRSWNGVDYRYRGTGASSTASAGKAPGASGDRPGRSQGVNGAWGAANSVPTVQWSRWDRVGECEDR